MLIDQFTAEQIEQIKTELKACKAVSKNNLTKAKERLKEIFPHDLEESGEGLLWSERDDLYIQINNIIDITLRNVNFEKSKRNGQIKAMKRGYVPAEIRDEYREFANEILDLIEKHKK